ncbi:MAG: thymidine phosphorylase [Bifidobacteriaceae bacterium]|nr:thymidine phosphorylase [Bifidobacteriaceae bacterium]
MNQPHKFRRPAMLDPRVADELPGGVDPAVLAELAHSSASALVERARRTAAEDPELVQRLLTLVETEGLEVVASLWAQAPADSLPGALWRVYLLREWVRRDPHTVSERYKLGITREQVAEVVAGAERPPGPQEMLQLADSVLSGLYTGELDVALERAAAFARILTTGGAMDADWIDDTEPARGAQVTRQAAQLLTMAEGLERAAALWRAGTLS